MECGSFYRFHSGGLPPHSIKKMLINYLCGMKRKAHGAQEPRHIQRYVEVTSIAQRSDSPAQAINQRFRKRITRRFLSATAPMVH